MNIKMAAGLAALGLGAAMLAGCSGDDDGGGGGGLDGKSADEIVAQVQDDMSGLASAQVAGAMTIGGQEFELDVQVSTDGECAGTFGIDGGSSEVLGADGAVWLKPDEAFWRASAGGGVDQVMKAVGDKWVEMPAEDGVGFAMFCDLDDLTGQLFADDDATTYSKAGEEELDGEQVIAIESDGEQGVSTGFVRAEAPHYLVKIEKTDGDQPGTVTLSGFDEPVEVDAPGDDEVIAITELMGG